MTDKELLEACKKNTISLCRKYSTDSIMNTALKER